MSYLVNTLAALSVVFNTLTGGSYRNTFSARVGYASAVPHCRWAVIAEKIINFIFQSDHCYTEYMNERETFK